MNGIQRRLLRAYLESGGSFDDEHGLSEFTAFVRGEIMLLSSRVRRAIELALEGRDDSRHALVAARLTSEEGRFVTVPTVRQRVSRGVRVLEKAIRMRRWRPHAVRALDGYASVPPRSPAPPINAQGGLGGQGVRSLTGRPETRESRTSP